MRSPSCPSIAPRVSGVRSLFLSALVAVPVISGCLVEVSDDALMTSDELAEGDAEVELAEAPLFGLCTAEKNFKAHVELALNADEYRGAPAWANDGTNRVLGAFRGDDRRRGDGSDDPCAYEKKNHRWQLFAVTPGSFTPAADKNAWLPGLLVELYYMKSAGYALVKALDDNLEVATFYRADVDSAGRVRGKPVVLGTQKVYQREPSLYRGDVRDIVPSPDGKLAADVVCHVSDEVDDGGYRLVDHPPCTVRFLDMSSIPVRAVGQSWSLVLATQLADYPPMVGDLSRQTDGVLWSRDGALVVTDQQESAFSVSPLSGPVATALPACGGPNTTSSQVAANGDRIGVQSVFWLGDKLAVVAPTAYGSTFGCK